MTSTELPAAANAGSSIPAGPVRRRRVRLRTLIALTMLLIASLGAGVAGWAAIKQQSGTGLERRLAQAQMMELSDRLGLIDQSRTARAMQARLDAHVATARARFALAGKVRADDADAARLYEFQTQEAMLLSNVVRPFVEYLSNVIAPDLTLDERRMGLVASGSLQRRGFQAAWTEGGAGAGASGGSNAKAAEQSQSRETARVTYLEKERIEAFDAQVLGLALVVVALVLALVLLTFADLAGTRIWVGVAFYAVAISVAAAAIAAALWIDPSLAVIVAGVTAAFAVFVLAAWGLGWLKAKSEDDELLQTQGFDAQGFAGASVQSAEASRGFSRFLVVAIALAALVSSVIGYWYSAASSRGDDAAHEGYQRQLDIVKRQGRSSTAVLGTFEGMVELYEMRVRCQAAGNLTALARDGRIATKPAAAAAAEEIACAALDPKGWPETRRADLADLDRRFGPQADPRFPLRLQAHVMGETADGDQGEALAEWDGFGEFNAFWTAKTTSFLAGLTIVAIALYVFGQALAMTGLGVSRAMAAGGVVMTLGALGWATATWFKPFPAGAAEAVAACERPAGVPKAVADWQSEDWMRVAARAYAKGSHQLIAAETEAEFAAAISALECAVAARPNLALAQNELAGAKALIQSAHKGLSYYSLPTKERLDEIERNFKAAVAIQDTLGLAANTYALNSHAVALWGLGIRDGKLPPIGEALRLVERAARIGEELEADRMRVSAADPSRNLYPWLSMLPLIYMNQSLFLIANDRLEDARVTVEKALALGTGRDWSLVGTMITATSLLDGNCERLHTAERCGPIRAALQSYKRALIEGQWTGETQAGAAKLEAIRVGATVSDTSVAARISGFDAAKDRLSVLWSAHDPQWNAADVLTSVPAGYRPGDIRVLKDNVITLARPVLSANAYKRCLGPGRYTAEVIVNGRTIGKHNAEIKGETTRAARLDQLNLAFCHPTTWTRWEADDGTVAGAEPMAGFRTAKGRPVAFLFAIPMPLGPQSEQAAATDYATRRALGALVKAGVVSGAIDALMSRVQTCDKAASGGIVRAATVSRYGSAYMALVLPDALEGIAACDLVRSVTIIQTSPG